MEYCFGISQEHVKNPYKGRKWICPLSDQILKNGGPTPQYVMSFDDLLMFLWNLPKETVVKTNYETKTPKTMGLLLPDSNKITIHFDFSSKKCSLSYVWNNKSLSSDYLKIVDKTGMKMGKICIFQNRIDNPLIAAKKSLTAKDELPLEHPFRVVSKKIIDTITNQSTLEFILVHAYCDEYRRQITSPTIPFNSEFFEKLQGYTKLFSIDNELFPTLFEDGQHFHSMIHLDASYDYLIQNGDFIELDASFEVFKPYVYCIPSIIIKNESFPFGLVIGPTESMDLYDTIYTTIKELNESLFQKLIKLPLLSDEGKALQALANKYELLHFLCYHHLIQKFGASSAMGLLVSELLYISDKYEFHHYWSTNINMIKRIYSDTTEDNKKRFCKLFLVEWNGEDFINPPKFDDQAKWRRQEFHVSTTTNHVESMHSKLNSKTAFVRNFMKKLKIVLEYLNKRRTRALKRPNFNRIVKKITSPDHRSCLCKLPFLHHLYSINVKKDYINKVNPEEFPCDHTIGYYENEMIKINYIDIPNKISYFSYDKNGKWLFPETNNIFREYSKLTNEDNLFIQYNGMPEKGILQNILKDTIIQRNVKITKQEFKNLFIRFSNSIYRKYDYQRSNDFMTYILKLSVDQSEAAKYLIELSNTYKIERESIVFPSMKSSHDIYDYEEEFDEEIKKELHRRERRNLNEENFEENEEEDTEKKEGKDAEKNEEKDVGKNEEKDVGKNEEKDVGKNENISLADLIEKFKDKKIEEPRDLREIQEDIKRLLEEKK